MNTRGNGSIIQLDRNKTRYACRHWRLHVSCGKDFKTGHYIQRTRRFNGTYTEAKNELRIFIAELKDQEYNPKSANTYTLEDYSAHFLALRKQAGDVSPSTLEKNRYHYAKLNELLGKAKLSELTPIILEDAFLTLRNDCSNTYLRGIYQSCNLMFNHAVKTGILNKNPLELVTMPKDDTKEKEVIPNDLLIDFIQRLDPTNKTEIAMYLIAVYGMRRMEPTCIRWKDISFDEKTIEIPRSKTRSGTRVLPLTPKASEALMTRRNAVKRERELIGLPWNEDALICSDADECGVTPRMITAWWEKYSEEYGLKDFTPHSFRHTFTTNLAKTKIHPSVMANLLGHSSSKVTMEVYTHIDTQEKEKALNELSKFLSA